MSKAAPRTSPGAASTTTLRGSCPTSVTQRALRFPGSPHPQLCVVVRCDLSAEDCITDHLCPALDGRCTSSGEQWSARCPAHNDRKRSLGITAGSRGQRIIWTCHAECEPAEVRRAMLLKGVSAGCVPWRPPATQGTGQPERTARKELEQLTAWLEELISEPSPGNELRLKIGARIWEENSQAVAAKLGLSRRTYYRRRTS